MTAEIPIWVDGVVQWLSGVDRRTTCRDVLELFAEGVGEGGDPSSYALVERWKEVERPLDMNSRLLKIWSHWGDEQKEVKLCLRRMDHEADSGRGSPEGAGTTMRRRRNKVRGSGRPLCSQQDGLHPRRLAELGGFDRDAYQEYEMKRLEVDGSAAYACGEKVYARTGEANVRRKSHHHHKNCPETGALHSTAIEGKSRKCCSKRQGKPKVRNSENIEKLMKLILAQGATIQTQLSKLKEREEQIENIEVERHKQRIEKNGRNYLLETYLESLKDAEVPATDEEKGNDSGVHTEAGSEQTNSGWEKEKGSDALPTRLRRSGSDENISKRVSRKDHSTKSKFCENIRPQRSKSEGRANDASDLDPLKRTLSDNNVRDKEFGETQQPSETKDSDCEIVELRRVQSQVELWEKVLKINKKLEKEEENLVRLHIQIRRIQSENIKLAKDQNVDPQAQSLQKQLEALRSDLDQNSKEIYNNFTQLIEDDETVVQKQDSLTELINDLDKTEKEHDILAGMLAAASSTPITAPVQNDNIGISLQVKGQEKRPQPDLIPANPPEYVEPPSDYTNQRSEEGVKPKILKISFDETIHDSESTSETDKPKDPSPIPQRNLKSILKNRHPDTFHVSDLEKVPVNYGSNISSQEIDPKISLKPPALDGTRSVYARPVNTYTNPVYGQTGFPQSSCEGHSENLYGHVAGISVKREPIYQPSSSPLSSIILPRDIKPFHVPVVTSVPKQNEAYTQRLPPDVTGYPTSVIVKTNAVVHHDTDSSGSSDTSGLSSMYSGSPTVEEPTYVLNTLV